MPNIPAVPGPLPQRHPRDGSTVEEASPSIDNYFMCASIISRARRPAQTPRQPLAATIARSGPLFGLVLRVLSRYLYDVYAYSPAVEMIIERGSRSTLSSLACAKL